MVGLLRTPLVVNTRNRVSMPEWDRSGLVYPVIHYQQYGHWTISMSCRCNTPGRSNLRINTNNLAQEALVLLLAPTSDHRT
jgi:hypothetical protein